MKKWGAGGLKKFSHSEMVAARGSRCRPVMKQGLTTMPFLIIPTSQKIDFCADASMINQVINWFGMKKQDGKAEDDRKINVRIKVSFPLLTQMHLIWYMTNGMLFPVRIAKIQRRERVCSFLNMRGWRYVKHGLRKMTADAQCMKKPEKSL